MLQKRRIPGMFYLGSVKDKANNAKIKAHSWSQCGERIITGEEEHEMFTVISVFKWSKQ